MPALAALTALASTPLAAQQPRDTIRLDSLVVTATRLPVPRAAVASPVTVIPGDELRRRGVHDLLEALRDLPGATLVQGGSFGTPASLFLRGGESDYVLVLVDGVPVNEPGGAFDFAHLTTDDVDRIEVVRGPASVLYGADAVAGVVQVFTRDGAGAPRWHVEAGAGTFATDRVGLGAAGGGERAGFSASASRTTSDGTWAFNSGYRRTDLAGLLRGRLDGRTDARLTLRLDDHVTHFPTDGAGRVVDHNQLTTGRETALGLEATRIVGERVALHLLLGSSVGDAGYDNRPDGPADTLGVTTFVSDGRTTRRGADLRAVVALGPGTSLTLGGALERQSDRSRDSTDGQYGPSLDSLAASRRNAAAYAQLLADAGGPFAVNLGARVDRNQRFGTAGTWRAGLSWRAARTARLRAAAGTAIKQPTFFENYAAGWVVGNRDLRPERSRSWEVGADFRLGKSIEVSGTWFDQRFTDLIQYTSAPPAPGAPNYFNIAASRARGLEADASLRLGGALTARAHYTYLQTAVLDAGFQADTGGPFAQGRPLLRRPAHAGGASLACACGPAVVTLGAEAVGRRDDMDYGGAVPLRVRLPAHLRVDASASAPLAGPRGGVGLSASLRVENLFGARYEEARGFPARGRTVLVGLRTEGGW